MGQAKKYQLVHGIELQVAMPSANGVLACLSRYSNISSQEAHNSVQDVLRRRDVPAAPPVKICEPQKTGARGRQNIEPEMQAHQAQPLQGRVPVLPHDGALTWYVQILQARAFFILQALCILLGYDILPDQQAGLRPLLEAPGPHRSPIVRG